MARRAVERLLIAIIKIYAYAISPLTPGRCRFYPTCSAYAQDAIACHGAVKGLALALRRIGRCHPFHKGPMIDPVPAIIAWPDIIRYNSRRACHTQKSGQDAAPEKEHDHAEP